MVAASLLRAGLVVVVALVIWPMSRAGALALVLVLVGLEALGLATAPAEDGGSNREGTERSDAYGQSP